MLTFGWQISTRLRPTYQGMTKVPRPNPPSQKQVGDGKRLSNGGHAIRDVRERSILSRLGAWIPFRTGVLGKVRCPRSPMMAGERWLVMLAPGRRLLPRTVSSWTSPMFLWPEIAVESHIRRVWNGLGQRCVAGRFGRAQTPGNGLNGFVCPCILSLQGSVAVYPRCLLRWP